MFPVPICLQVWDSAGQGAITFDADELKHTNSGSADAAGFLGAVVENALVAGFARKLAVEAGVQWVRFVFRTPISHHIS
jgi:hypothetical protein